MRRRMRRVSFDCGIATLAQCRQLVSGDSETLRSESEDKGLESNGDARTLNAEAKRNLLDTMVWRLQYCAKARTVEEWKPS